MSTELTAKAQIKADSRTQNPQLVLRIDGVDTIYGIGSIKKYVRLGDPGLVIGDDWTIGGLNAYDDQLDVINLDGSSNTISQQLLQDKGGTTSVPSIQISLIDKNGLITKLITPGEVVDDILGRKAWVYLGYAETAWPQDFVRIFSGIIDDIIGGTSIVINVAHAEQKKRVEIFQKITTELTSPLNFRSSTIQGILYRTRTDVVGTVTVNYTSGALQGEEVVSVSGNNITVQIENGVSRARDIRDAIEKSIDALSLVEIKVSSGAANQLQNVTGSPISLLSDTTINVKSTKGMLSPVPAEGFRTYVRIDDEVIEYTGLTDTTLTGCVREALVDRDPRAQGDFHDDESTVETFYRLEGQAIDIALKVLMSGGAEYYASGVKIKSIVEVENVGPIANAVWFENINIQDEWGVTVNDKVTISGDPIPSNNVVGALISDIVVTPIGSYIVLDPSVTLTTQTVAQSTISFGSKWNVLPQGAGLELGGDEVDVPEFERIRETFASSLFTYDFYLKDTVTAKDFLDTEVLFPTGAFSLPRKGKVSVGYTTPPIGAADLKVLDSSNTSRPDQTKIRRSLNKYFYNNILFRFNEAVTDELYLSGDLEVNQDSKNRIPIGNKTLIINARGLRPSTDADVIIEILKKRFNDKYKFGAELVSTQAFYGKAFNTDVGDVVVFGDKILQLPDTKKGSREFAPRLFEVSNKSLSIKTGEVKLELLDSGYSLADGRYGIVSPSSLTVAGAAGDTVKIKTSYETIFPQLERTKWTPYVNQKILIHDDMWDNIHETVLLGFSASDNYLMLLKDPVPFAIGEDYVVEIAHYPDNADEEDLQLPKRVFVFTNPTVEVESGTSDLEFTVPLADADKFLVGAIVLVRDTEWDVVSPEVKVESVLGQTITVSASLGFTPSAGYEIDFIGFKDGGAPYRYL